MQGDAARRRFTGLRNAEDDGSHRCSAVFAAPEEFGRVVDAFTLPALRQIRLHTVRELNDLSELDRFNREQGVSHHSRVCRVGSTIARNHTETASRADLEGEATGR